MADGSHASPRAPRGTVPASPVRLLPHRLRACLLVSAPARAELRELPCPPPYPPRRPRCACAAWPDRVVSVVAPEWRLVFENSIAWGSSTASGRSVDRSRFYKKHRTVMVSWASPRHRFLTSSGLTVDPYWYGAGIGSTSKPAHGPLFGARPIWCHASA
jgi:hypothetical protein